MLPSVKASCYADPEAGKLSSSLDCCHVEAVGSIRAKKPFQDLTSGFRKSFRKSVDV